MGFLYLQMNRTETAHEMLTRERLRLEEVVRATPDDHMSRSQILLCRAGLGDTVGVKEAATRILREGEAMGLAEWNVASALAHVGEANLAVDCMKAAFESGTNHHLLYREGSARWELLGCRSLSDNPRYRGLVIELEKDLDRLRRTY